MKAKEFNYTKGVLTLIFISTVIRIALALILDLAEDEAYFRTFALFPELSNFDKPPMIGWIIQLFTNNLYFNSEFAIRLSSILCGSTSMWVIYIIARRLSRETAGFYSVLLYATSFYFSIYSSLLALPESPQTLFYLLSLYFIIEALFPRRKNCEESTIISNMAYILAGIFIGLSILSEFSSAMIWPAIFIYLLIYNRSQFKRLALYLSLITSLLFLIPLYIWYFGYNLPGSQYITLLFNFNGSFPIREMAKGLLVVIVLNNPINIAIIFYSIVKFNKRKIRDNKFNLLITISSITAITFLSLSVFSGIFIYAISHTFIPLLFIAGDYMSKQLINREKLTLHPYLNGSIYLYITLLSIITLNNYTGIINNNVFVSKSSLTKPDHYLSHQFGWSDLTTKFSSFLEKERSLEYLNSSFFIVENNYKKAAIIDYYIASPNNMAVKAIGTLSEIRKYAWITQKLKFFKKGENAYYIDDSSSPENAIKFGESYYQKVEKASVVYIMKMGKPVKKYTIYRFLNLKTLPVQNNIEVVNRFYTNLQPQQINSNQIL